MKTDLSLVALATEIERRKDEKKDYVANTSKMTMMDNSNLTFENGVRHDLVVNDVAHKQIAARLEIPGKYYDRMRTEAPALLATNVNHFLHNEPETRLVRTLDGKVRAFLSDRYQRIENEEIANMVLPILLEQKGVKVASASITETRMYIKATFTHIRAEVKVGDEVESGVIISNSEVGLGAVNISPFVNRLVCMNGMVVNDGKFAMRHLGGRLAEGQSVYEMLTDETLKADDKAILLKVRDVLRGCFDEVRFRKTVARMTEATTQKIEGNPVEAVKLLAKKQSLTGFEETSILRNLIEGADLSRWGLINAVTATAKEDVLDYDRATELETLGGNLLMLPAPQFKEYALAA